MCGWGWDGGSKEFCMYMYLQLFPYNVLNHDIVSSLNCTLCELWYTCRCTCYKLKNPTKQANKIFSFLVLESTSRPTHSNLQCLHFCQLLGLTIHNWHCSLEIYVYSTSLDVIVHWYNGNVYLTKHNRKAISVHPAVSLCDSLNNKPKQYLNCTRQYARKNVNAFERNATSTRN